VDGAKLANMITLRRKQMRRNKNKIMRLGDLIVAIFDEAAHYSTDPKEVSRRATQTVMHMLQSARRRLVPLSPSSVSNKACHGGKQAHRESMMWTIVVGD
jgi:hypothetical protein